MLFFAFCTCTQTYILTNHNDGIPYQVQPCGCYSVHAEEREADEYLPQPDEEAIDWFKVVHTNVHGQRGTLREGYA